MKRIFFTQQKQYRYFPLRAGLELISENELEHWNILPSNIKLCPKIYTTRTHPLSGEYVVVEGSRYKAKPVEPRIKFQCSEIYELNLRTGMILSSFWSDGLWRKLLVMDGIIHGERYSMPELDLGIRDATFEQLRDELLKLNKKVTIDTLFYVNKLEPL